MLLWIAALLSSPEPPRPCRRIRRYRDVSLGVLTRLVRNLIIIRAAELACMRPRPNRARPHAPPGFRKRARPHHLVRAAAGAWLRRALRHRDPELRIARLLDALANIDTFAQRLMRRFRRRLTRLRPIIPVRPPHVALASLAAPAPCAADSS